MTEPIRNLLAKAIDDLDAGKEVDLIELERECKAADLAQAPAPVRDGMDVLSGLSSYLGAGLGNETTTAEDYDKRIRWGIDYNASATVRLCADVIERLSKDAYSGQPIQWGQIKSAVLAVSPALEAPDAGVVAELVEAAKALVEQAAHVAMGGRIPEMDIHDSARNLTPLVDRLNTTLAKLETRA